MHQWLSSTHGIHTDLKLWPANSPTDPQTPENSKTQKSDSKVIFGLPAKVTQKLLKSDSKVTETVEKVTFESLLSNFWVTLAGSPKVTFESLFCVFEFAGVWGSVGELAGHRSKTFRETQVLRARYGRSYLPISYFSELSRAAKRVGFKRGGFPIWACPSFLVVFGTFPIFLGFSRFVRGWSRDLPDSSLFSFLAY